MHLPRPCARLCIHEVYLLNEYRLHHGRVRRPPIVAPRVRGRPVPGAALLRRWFGGFGPNRNPSAGHVRSCPVAGLRGRGHCRCFAVPRGVAEFSATAAVATPSTQRSRSPTPPARTTTPRSPSAHTTSTGRHTAPALPRGASPSPFYRPPPTESVECAGGGSVVHNSVWVWTTSMFAARSCARPDRVAPAGSAGRRPEPPGAGGGCRCRTAPGSPWRRASRWRLWSALSV